MSSEIVFKKKNPKAGLRCKRKIINVDSNDGFSKSEPNSENSCSKESFDTIQQDKQCEPEVNVDEDLGIDLQKLQDLRELRELKKNQSRGLSAEQLLTLGTGSRNGIINRKKVGLTTFDALVKDLDLGKTFSAETNRRDEDADMLKFIEEELAKRKGQAKEESNNQEIKLTGNLNDLVFNVLPEHLVKSNVQKTEEMLSNQMLSGIPEVDLGIQERIRNIEATELAKQKVIKKEINPDASKTNKANSTFTSANYVQHNKFNINDPNSIHHSSSFKKPRIEPAPVKVVKEAVVVIGDEPKESLFKIKTFSGPHALKFPGREKATDDYHYEKFKKSFRK